MDPITEEFRDITLAKVVKWVCATVMIFGGVVPYIPQYIQIYTEEDAQGFSMYVCLALLIANTLRILFWFGKRYELPLLVQSIIMNIMMLAMIQLCVRVRNKTNLVPYRGQDKFFTARACRPLLMPGIPEESNTGMARSSSPVCCPLEISPKTQLEEMTTKFRSLSLSVGTAKEIVQTSEPNHFADDVNKTDADDARKYCSMVDGGAALILDVQVTGTSDDTTPLQDSIDVQNDRYVPLLEPEKSIPEMKLSKTALPECIESVEVGRETEVEVVTGTAVEVAPRTSVEVATVTEFDPLDETSPFVIKRRPTILASMNIGDNSMLLEIAATHHQSAIRLFERVPWIPLGSFRHNCHKSYFDWRYFWQWTDFQSYLDFLLALSISLSLLTFLCINSTVFIELLGFMAVFTEAMLGVPQLLKNLQSRSTVGMNLLMVLMWTAGDAFKTVYFVVREAPLQFWICGTLQVIIDIAILGQVYWYHRPDNATATVRPTTYRNDRID